VLKRKWIAYFSRKSIKRETLELLPRRVQVAIENTGIIRRLTT
jgi:hypothetical protein